ncbi:MAG: NUDIX hydrolase [Chloroflexi bacterium]|nr:NUDIX hydrolase [Chloroflexota bacterium]
MRRPSPQVMGIDQAIARYGAPIERSFSFVMGQEFMEYWEHVLANREAEVVLAMQYPHGGFLIHTKREYPAGVYRLCSGGINRGEPLLTAVARELEEETGLHGDIQRFLGILTSRLEGDGRVLFFTSYVFHIHLKEGTLAPQDDAEGILGFREVSLPDLATVAADLASLEGPFWGDWGRFRAAAHRFVVEALTPIHG